MTTFSFDSDTNIEIPLKGSGTSPMIAISWCMKHLPKSTWAVRSRWPMNEYLFYFSRPQDAIWFSLAMIT